MKISNKMKAVLGEMVNPRLVKLFDVEVIVMVSFILLAVLLAIPKFSSASMVVWIDHGSTKIRQQGDYTGTGQQTVKNISLRAAKNEFEPFQIFVYANGETLTNVNVTVSDLTSGANTIPGSEVFGRNIWLYKEGYINITSVSRSDYSTGLWPDPLFPKYDIYYNEARTTFPFSVTSGNVQGVWVDLGTTSSTPSGIYTGTYTVTADGKPSVTGTITLQVWDFTLPSTATQKNMWMVDESALATGFYGASQSAAWTASMLNLSQKSFLYHRIGLNTKGGGVQFNGVPSADGTISFSSNYLTAYASLLDGTAIPSGPYAGAKKSVQNIEMSHALSATWDGSSTKHTKSLQSYWDYYTAHGWEPLKRLFAYTVDEPTGGTVTYRGTSVTDYAVILAKMTDMNAVNTGGLGTWKNTFTTENRDPLSPQNALITASPSFDTNGTWCPLYVHYEYYSPVQATTYKNARSSYPDYSSWPTRDHWAYHSNMNLAVPTGGVGQIDANTETPAFWTRAIPWIDWTYRVTGNLYYHTNVLWASAYQPYVNTKVEGVNGQSTSFYPGVASKTGRTLPASTPAIGGTHDIPIESIKMKLFREGQEDREYMELLRVQGRTSEVDAVVDTLYSMTGVRPASKYYTLKNNITDIFTAREALANKILTSPGAPSAPKRVIRTP